MKIRDRNPTQTTEAMAQSWAAMSLDLFTHVVTEASQNQNVAVLQTLVDGGALDIEDLERHVNADRCVLSRKSSRLVALERPPRVRLPRSPLEIRRQTIVHELWMQRIVAFLAFTHNLGYQMAGKNFPGTSIYGRDITVLRTNLAFETWFHNATTIVLCEFSRAQQWCEENDPESLKDLHQVMAFWMACACMMDLPETVLQVHAACPQAHRTFFSLSLLGECAKSRMTSHRSNAGVEVWANPMLLALECSSPKCLRLFGGHCPDGLLPRTIVGLSFKTISKSWPAWDQAELSPVRMSDVVNSGPVHFYCDDETRAWVARRMLVGKKEQTQVLNMALCALEGGLGHIEAFLQAGVYHAYPRQSISVACQEGLFTLVKELAPLVRWSQITPQTLHDAIEKHPAVSSEATRRREDAIVHFVRGAFEHGGPSAMAHVFSMKTFAMVLEKRLERVLLALLDTGAVHPNVADASGQTPIAKARALQSPLAGVMASWLARRTAHSLLDDLALDGFLSRSHASAPTMLALPLH